MAEQSLITGELRKLIGVPFEPVIYRIEEGAIQRYAEAVGDPNPLYNDVEYARNSKYGRLICPPGFFGWPVRGEVHIYRVNAAMMKAGAPPGLLDGGIEFEFLIPVGAGDMLAISNKIASIVERQTRLGKTIFTTVESTYLNQNGDIAIKSRATFIGY